LGAKQFSCWVSSQIPSVWQQAPGCGHGFG
jgi:hypothetical protein